MWQTFAMLSAGYLIASRNEVDSVELPYLNRARLAYTAQRFLASGVCGGVWRVLRGCLESVCRLFGGLLEGVQEGASRVFGGLWEGSGSFDNRFLGVALQVPVAHLLKFFV